MPATFVKKKIKLMSLLLVVQWPNNYLMVMTSLFWKTRFVKFLIVVRQKMTFLESWDKSGQDMYYVCLRKVWFSKCGHHWPVLHLTLGHMWKWMSPSNSRAKWAINHVSHATRTIFSYDDLIWPDLTWPWPCPVLSISRLFTWHLRHPFSSISGKFALAAVSGLI